MAAGARSCPPRPTTKRLDAAQAAAADSATGDRAVEPASSALFGGKGTGRAAGAPTLRRAIVELLGKQGPMKSANIARALNHPADPTRSALFKLAREGVLEKGQGPEAPYSLPGGQASEGT